MSLQPFERRVPVHSDSLHDHDGMLSRASIGTRLTRKAKPLNRPCLQSLAGRLLLGFRKSRSVRNYSASSGWNSMPKVSQPLNAQHRSLKTKRRLDARLRDNDQALRAAYRATAEAVRAGTHDHSRRKLASRQFSCGRGAGSGDPGRSPTRLLSPVAETDGRAIRRISAGVRVSLGIRRPHRQPFRPTKCCVASRAPTSAYSR